MEHLWAPWRLEFIKGPRPGGCFFCDAAKAAPADEPAHLVLARTATALAILNRYPYNNGHLMVAPIAHIASLELLPPGTATDVMVLTQRALRVLQNVLTPEGFNVGINQGKTAGAGVADHVHQHVVPRWGGDTNFMPVIADTKVLSESLSKSYTELRAGFDRMA